MSLRQRNGHWHYRFKYKGQEYTGNTDLAATPQNKKDAQAIETAALQALKQGKIPAAQMQSIPFHIAVAKFATWAEMNYRSKPNSYKRIKTSLSSALVFFDKSPVSTIDAARLDDYKTWRATEHEVKDVTIRHDIHALSTFFQYATRHHWTANNPTREITIPSDADSQRMHVLDFQQEEEYFRRAQRNTNLHDLALLIINQGFRPEEATSLKKADVDLAAGKIYVSDGKTKAARRHLDMTADARKVLRARMAGPSPWIFPSERKLGCHIGRVNSAHNRIVDESARDGVDLNFVLYDLRHTFATRMAEAGCDIKTLADILGHSSLRCVHKYVHPSAGHKKLAMQQFERSVKDGKRKAKENSERAA